MKVKKLQVLITPEKGWNDTTTYSIFFRDGVQDITEGNIPPNLKLAFSTGPHHRLPQRHWKNNRAAKRNTH
ncbi:MAG: hypothetical protein WDN75_02135 [Bacteroidota bacterium]